MGVMSAPGKAVKKERTMDDVKDKRAACQISRKHGRFYEKKQNNGFGIGFVFCGNAIWGTADWLWGKGIFRFLGIYDKGLCRWGGQDKQS